MSIYSRFKYNKDVLYPSSKVQDFLNKNFEECLDPFHVLMNFHKIDRGAGNKFHNSIAYYQTNTFDVENSKDILMSMSEISFLEYYYSKYKCTYVHNKSVIVHDLYLLGSIRNFMDDNWNGRDLLVAQVDDVDSHYYIFELFNDIYFGHKNSPLYDYLFYGDIDIRTKNQLDFISIWMGFSSCRGTGNEYV